MRDGEMEERQSEGGRSAVVHGRRGSRAVLAREQAGLRARGRREQGLEARQSESQGGSGARRSSGEEVQGREAAGLSKEEHGVELDQWSLGFGEAEVRRIGVARWVRHRTRVAGAAAGRDSGRRERERRSKIGRSGRGYRARGLGMLEGRG